MLSGKGAETYRGEGEDTDESQLHHLKKKMFFQPLKKISLKVVVSCNFIGVSLPEQQLHSVLCLIEVLINIFLEGPTVLMSKVLCGLF